MLFTCALVFVLPGYIFGQYLPLLDTDYEQSAEYNAYSAFQGPDSNLMQDFYQNNKLDKSADIAGESHSNEEFDEADNTIVLGPDILVKSYKYQIWEKPDPDLVSYYNRKGQEQLIPCKDNPVRCPKKDFTKEGMLPITYNPHGLTSKWPNTTIYYEIDSSVSKDKVKEILFHIKLINQRTCLNIIKLPTPRPNVDSYISYHEKHFCNIPMGYRKGLIIETWLSGCNGSLAILHALNFDHIHNAGNRDEYITINMDNIGPSHVDQNFQKQNARNFDIRYDYESAFHMHNCVYAKSELPVITYNRCPSMRFEDDRQVTEWDYFKINRLYCPKWYYNKKK
ncbi:seminal metalloprotease 1-like [Scaptodrosophila lebanonensis]|uniref:Seminal metalloprotease 1-like n=1 Tax=Drosophila lebanonensis TaxID=7225 RepID=A0A6J2TQB9_DROLE|nr:seminal metalloprotease 1-like [Scaptodrosophila lebanonensis]